MGNKIWVIEDDPEPLVALVPLESLADKMARANPVRPAPAPTPAQRPKPVPPAMPVQRAKSVQLAKPVQPAKPAQVPRPTQAAPKPAPASMPRPHPRAEPDGVPLTAIATTSAPPTPQPIPAAMPISMRWSEVADVEPSSGEPIPESTPAMPAAPEEATIASVDSTTIEPAAADAALAALIETESFEATTSELVDVEPVVDEPVIDEPVIVELVAVEPVVSEPVLVELVVSAPVIIESAPVDVISPPAPPLPIEPASLESAAAPPPIPEPEPAPISAPLIAAAPAERDERPEFMPPSVPEPIPSSATPTADEILASLAVMRSAVASETVVPLAAEIRPRMRNRPPPPRAQKPAPVIPLPLHQPAPSPAIVATAMATPSTVAAPEDEAYVHEPRDQAEPGEGASEIDVASSSKTEHRPAWRGTAGGEPYAPPPVGPLCQAILTYLTGPLAVLVTSRGRRSIPWLILGVLATLGWLGTNRWENLMFRFRDPAFLVAGWIAATVVTTMAGFTAWAWAVRQAGCVLDETYAKFPRWIRKPGVVGLLGLVVPGLGLFIAGRRRSAAFALWLAGPFVLGIVLVGRAGWLWELNFGSARAGLPGRFLEWVFLAAAALIITGALFWVVQALEGLRRAQPAHAPGSSRAAWTAAALVVTLIASCFAFQPAGIARNLDQQAFSLEGTGYRVIPLLMTCAATRLDASHPEYALHNVNLYEMNGQVARAERARADLDRRLSPYVNTLRREGWRP